MAFSSVMNVDIDDSDIELSGVSVDIEFDQLLDAVVAKLKPPEAANELVSFRWEIRNFSQLGPLKIKSETFSAGEFQWQILLFPKGDGTDHLSLYLESADTKSLPFVHFQLTVIDQIDQNRSVKRDTRGQVSGERCLGFKCFMPLGDLLDPTRDFLVDDILVVKAEVFRCKKEEDLREVENENGYVENVVHLGGLRKDNVYESIKEDGAIDNSQKDTGYLVMRNSWDERQCEENKTSYMGIKNQGLTCYMNSVIQTLYHIPCFRKAVYRIPTTKEEIPSESTPLALQRVFYMLQFGKSCVSTTELAASFGSRWQSFVMQDVFEFCEFLSSQLKEKIKGTVAEKTMEDLFQVGYLDIIECLHVDYKSKRPDKSNVLRVTVEGCSGVYTSFDEIVGPELLDEKFDAGTEYGEQDAQRITKFTHLPPVLQLQLKRFSRDIQGNTRKINDYYEFPLELDLDRGDGKYLSSEVDKEIQNRYILHSVLAHIGDVNRGHYYAFIRPTLSDEWYKFNDETVTKEDATKAIEGLFGGNDRGSMKANAYMLVYIRESDKDTVMCSVSKEDIPQHLEERFLEEQARAHKLTKQLEINELCFTGEDVKETQPHKVVRFRSQEEPREKFTLQLPASLSYDAVVARVAEHIGVDDHSRIQLTCRNITTRKPNFEPIRQHTLNDILQMLYLNYALSKNLYYKLLDITPQETEAFKTLKIEFHLPAAIDKVETHTIRLPKAGTVGDALDILRTKVYLSHAGAELRMFEVFSHKIYKVFSPEENIADINNQFMTLRAEEISEEEKNLGPGDRLIHVYHFADSMQVKVFGYPFFLVIHEEERFADIKRRLQKKVGVSDTVFARWKFMFLGLVSPEELEDSDVLMRYFKKEEKNSSVAHQPFLGIHHT